MLNNEPELDHYGFTIIKAAKLCSNISEIMAYGALVGVVDLEEFVDLVISARQTINPEFVVKHAKN